MSDNMTLDDYFKSEDDNKKANIKRNLFRRKKNDKKLKSIESKTSREKETEYPKSYTAMIYMRIVLWLLIALLTIKGASTIIYPPRLVIKVEKYIPDLSESEKVKAFAEQYVREYLTYDSSNLSDYTTRVSKYTSAVISPSDKFGWSKVVESNIFDVRKINDKNAVITVYAKLRQGKEVDAETLKTEETFKNINQEIEKLKEVYVKVPVKATREGNMVIPDYPVFVSSFDKIDIYESAAYKNIKNTTDNTRNEIQSTLHNFFSIYDEGTPEQISYFMLDAQKKKGYEGSYKYQRIKTLETMNLDSNENLVLALVEIVVIDEFGTSFEQKYTFQMKKEKKQKSQQDQNLTEKFAWYIEKFLDIGEEPKI